MNGYARTLRCHLERVAGQVRHVQDPPQLGLHQRLARGIDTAPLAERRDHPRRDLAVHRVERDDRVGQEPIAAARRVVEPHRIAGGEAADQGAHAVRVAQVVVGVPRQRAHRLQRARQLRRSPGSRTTCPAPARRRARRRGTRPAPPCARGSRCRPARRAPPARRSCFWPASNCALARRTPSGSTAEIGQARVAQRAAADRAAIDPVRPGVGQPRVGGAQCVAQLRRRSPRARVRAPRGSRRHRRPAIWSARKVSLGRLSASAAKAGSASPSARVAAIASISAAIDRPVSRRGDTRPPDRAAVPSRIAARTPSARTDRCRAPRESAAAPASGRTA